MQKRHFPCIRPLIEVSDYSGIDKLEGNDANFNRRGKKKRNFNPTFRLFVNSELKTIHRDDTSYLPTKVKYTSSVFIVCSTTRKGN